MHYEPGPGSTDSGSISKGHLSVAVAVAEGGSAAFLWSLAAIIHSLWLDLKLVQALVITEHHSIPSNARDSSSPSDMPSCLRQSLIKSVNHFLGGPSGHEPWTSSPYSSWRGRRELSIFMTCPIHHSWTFNIMASIPTR